MYSSKKYKIFAFFCLFTSILSVLVSIIARFPYDYVHLSSLIFYDIVPNLAVILFCILAITTKGVKALIPLIIGQISTASTCLMYYTRENAEPWTLHLSFSVNNLINFLPYITVAAVMLFIVFSALKSLRAVLICFITAFVPEIIRTVYNLTSVRTFRFPYPMLIQALLLISTIFLFLLSLRKRQTILNEEYNLESIADSLKENYSNGESAQPIVVVEDNKSTEPEIKQDTISINQDDIPKEDTAKIQLPVEQNLEAVETKNKLAEDNNVEETLTNDSIQHVKPLLVDYSKNSNNVPVSEDVDKESKQDIDSVQRVTAVPLTQIFQASKQNVSVSKNIQSATSFQVTDKATPLNSLNTVNEQFDSEKANS